MNLINFRRRYLDHRKVLGMGPSCSPADLLYSGIKSALKLDLSRQASVFEICFLNGNT